MESRLLGRAWPLAALALVAIAATLTFAHAASAAGPSVHCHVTDGVFTTCPDGSSEWSDVPSKSFPHAHLYADEADLDPSLSSGPNVPADTLMLMYDECGRRQPLGPNEPFIVSFATVEDAEGGKHELRHYVIHVFTDGTIVFLEDGVPVKDEDGNTRVHEIEGQRGAASFGRSPNCSFDHVIAEFEIKLTATGLDLDGGYSPDPIFWGAEPENRPPVAVDDADKLETGDSVTTNVVANDSDPDDGLDPSSVSIVTPPENGDATANGDGTVTYTAQSHDSFGPSDSYTYTVADTKAARSNAATVEITACPPGNAIPVTLPEVHADASLLKPFTVKYEQLPLTFTTQTPASPAFCQAQSNTGTLNVDVTCRFIRVLPCPFPPFIPVTVAHSTATATLSFFKAGDVPAPAACDFSSVTTGCVLNPGAGGDLVRWDTPGFHITDRFTGTTLHDTGPHTFYAFSGGITSPSASFASKVQALETYFHVTLISHLSSIVRLAVVQDPPADLLVTDPGGRRTGVTPAGDTVTEIPASGYFNENGASAVVIVEPQVGRYTTQVVGPFGEHFDLSMVTLDLRGSAESPGVIEERRSGFIGPAAVFPFDVPERITSDGAVISNGVVQLGVNREGELNVPGDTRSSGPFGTTTVGLRYVPTGAEAVAPGCLCEGWGVADAISGVHGEADISSDGVQNMTVESFFATDARAHSTVRVGDTFRVTHDYHESPSPNLYEATVTIENVSGAPVDVRYRRAVDWDVEPTAFSEFSTVVTMAGTERARNVLFSSDDGFASANPLAGPSQIDFSGDSIDNGPDDHGALFDLGFGTVPAGGEVTFQLYYGAAGTEVAANAALRAVHAQVYSYGQPSTPGGPSLGTPNTFILAFVGVGEPTDTDRDGTLDDVDNCPATANSGQRDGNLNGIGDACETPAVDHSTAVFLQAGLDGQTTVEATPVAAGEEPTFTERLVRIVSFRIDSGLAQDPQALTQDLVGSLVEAGAVTQANADELVHDVIAGLDDTPPLVRVSFPAPDGADGWFASSPVTGTVSAEDPSKIAEITCTGATVGPVTGVGTTSASATLTVTGDGVHAVSCTAKDGADNAGAATGSAATATVKIDRTAPTLACSPTPALLWPPNHKLVAVTVGVTLRDAVSGPGGFVLVSATSSEPDDAQGDGDKGDDIQGWTIGGADTNGLLRAERSGGGPGRTYTLVYRGSDAAGNTATCSAKVVVPHDRGDDD